MYYIMDDLNNPGKFKIEGRSHAKGTLAPLPSGIEHSDAEFLVMTQELDEFGETVNVFSVDQVKRLAAHEAKEAKKLDEDKKLKDKADLKIKKEEFISRGDVDEMIFDYMQLIAMKTYPAQFASAKLTVDSSVVDDEGNILLRKGDKMNTEGKVLIYAYHFLVKANNYFIFRMNNK